MQVTCPSSRAVFLSSISVVLVTRLMPLVTSSISLPQPNSNCRIRPGLKTFWIPCWSAFLASMWTSKTCRIGWRAYSRRVLECILCLDFRKSAVSELFEQQIEKNSFACGNVRFLGWAWEGGGIQVLDTDDSRGLSCTELRIGLKKLVPSHNHVGVFC